MNMKPMPKSAIKPIPSVKSIKIAPKSSILTKLFRLESSQTVNALRAENQELILMNQRHMESIKYLADQLAESLSFQQNSIQSVSETLKNLENLPHRQEDLQQKIMDSFDKATFFIQGASQDLVQAKAQLFATQNDYIESAGAIEIAEFMQNFLITNLLTKQARLVLESFIGEKIQLKEGEMHLSKLQKNLQIVRYQISQINFKLEKYYLKLEESIWKPYAPEFQTAELVEHCAPDDFFQLLRHCQKIGIFEEGEKVKSLVVAETLPAISFFNKEKGSWVVKRRAKVVTLKPQ